MCARGGVGGGGVGEEEEKEERREAKYEMAGIASHETVPFHHSLSSGII